MSAPMPREAARQIDGSVIAAPETVFYLTGTGRGDYFISNAVLLGPKGAEVLTRTPVGPLVK